MINKALQNKNPFFYFLVSFIFVSTLTIPSYSYAKLRNYETTRLKSTAGAGVGSILLNESAILNPASVAFFNMSSLYFQMEKSDLSGNDPGKQAEQRRFSDMSDTKSMIMADTRRAAKGSVAYYQQSQGYDSRERLSMALARTVGKTSSLGVQFRQTKDVILSAGPKDTNKYSQINFGASHVVSDSLSFGVLWIDPFKSHSEDTQVLVGTQYLIKNIFALMADIGTNYESDPSSTLLYRLAMQVNFFSDFYLRAGLFNDKGMGEKGNGLGLSWVGPKFSLDAAMKLTKSLGNGNSPLANGERLKETSMSLTYLF